MDLSATLAAAADVFATALQRTIDRELIRAVEILEGRVPSNDEITTHGHHFIYPDGRSVWTWKDREILELTPGTSAFRFQFWRYVQPDASENHDHD